VPRSDPLERFLALSFALDNPGVGEKIGASLAAIRAVPGASGRA
jgi:hypothetical protein